MAGSGPLRKSGWVALSTGALGAVGLVLYTGRRNPSALLMALFVIWVLVPFAALAAADATSKEWPLPARTALYALMIVIALDTLGIYGYIAFGPARPQPAFWFLVTPPVSVVVIGVVMWAASVTARRRSSDVFGR